jgi:hypothetical protein
LRSKPKKISDGVESWLGEAYGTICQYHALMIAIALFTGIVIVCATFIRVK